MQGVMMKYPEHLISTYQLSDGTKITIRPVKPDDADMLQECISKLSSASKHSHFMAAFRQLSKDMLDRFTQIDYAREMVLIATCSQKDKDIMIGMSRYVTTKDPETCEVLVVVADDWQDRKIATRLMNDLIKAARENGLKKMTGLIQASDVQMLAVARHFGFAIEPGDDATMKVAIMDLSR